VWYYLLKFSISAAIIVAATSYIAHREARAGGRKT